MLQDSFFNTGQLVSLNTSASPGQTREDMTSSLATTSVLWSHSKGDNRGYKLQETLYQ